MTVEWRSKILSQLSRHRSTVSKFIMLSASKSSSLASWHVVVSAGDSAAESALSTAVSSVADVTVFCRRRTGGAADMLVEGRWTCADGVGAEAGTAAAERWRWTHATHSRRLGAPLDRRSAHTPLDASVCTSGCCCCWRWAPQSTSLYWRDGRRRSAAVSAMSTVCTGWSRGHVERWREVQPSDVEQISSLSDLDTPAVTVRRSISTRWNGDRQERGSVSERGYTNINRYEMSKLLTFTLKVFFLYWK